MINYRGYEVNIIQKPDNKYYAYYQVSPFECFITQANNTIEDARLEAFQYIDEELKAIHGSNAEYLEDEHIEQLNIEQARFFKLLAENLKNQHPEIAEHFTEIIDFLDINSKIIE